MSSLFTFLKLRAGAFSRPFFTQKPLEMEMEIKYFHKYGQDLVGFIPTFLRESDPRPAAAQFNERYAHGGGWSPMEGWALEIDSCAISYPGDPAYQPVAAIDFRDERIYVYQHAWVAIVQADGSFEVERMD